LLRWFRRLIAQKEGDKYHEKPLASGENEWRQSLPMGTAAPAQGEVIADYEIVERIGGNMGLVFKARHRLLDKVVALKLVPADWMADPARLARFQREMRVMGQLEHPNLVTAADARSVGEWHLVAMELIDGVDLQQVVRTQGPLPVAAACEVARQAALGLQYAHQHGLIHRDIKPSNLMLTRSGTIKVIDMGLALARDDSTGQLTQAGFVLGTMSYCAPEQFRDASHVDIRADIYSLGCTVYHLITGQAPYCQRKTVAEIMQAHLHEPFPSLTETLPGAPAKLEAVLARMTAKDRDARFSTPNEVVKALEPFARGADLAPLVPAKSRENPRPRITTSRALPTPDRQLAVGREALKAGWPRAAALLVLLLAVAGTVFLAMNRSQLPSTVTNQSADTRIRITLMDTTAVRGIYDDDNKVTGRSNSKELYDLLTKQIPEIPPENIDEHSVDVNWDRRNRVRLHRPHLLVIHRSVFFHPIAAALAFPYPEEIRASFSDKAKVDEELRQFEKRYKFLGDDPLREFLNDIGTAVPRTRFLVYSRGTDTNWHSSDFRLTWIKELEKQYPVLTGRVTAMLIEPELTRGKETSSFRNPKTSGELLRIVRKLLALPERREVQKIN
jgi:serine/threonine protein kinase